MRRTWGVVAAVIGILGVLWVVLVAAPPWFVHDRSLEGLKAQNEVRTTLLQGLGGVVLLVGAYFTYRQLHTAREGQITERFSRAIDQLGSGTLDVRLGGIYALERIAKNSEIDRGVVIEVLTAYIRGHSIWKGQAEGEQPATNDGSGAQAEFAVLRKLGELPWLQFRAADIQAIMTVLNRLEAGRTDYPNLWGVDLRRADLRDINLDDAVLIGANLQGAMLTSASLRRASLVGVKGSPRSNVSSMSTSWCPRSPWCS